MRQYGLEVETKSGQRLDWRTMDWRNLDIRDYEVVQPAGRKSVMGYVKFSFPSQHTIFMHDTPDRHLFRRPDRAFSSGCIRLERPAELMAVLLDGTPGWDVARAQRALDARSTSVVSLRRVLPVSLVYRTVMLEAGGRIRIRHQGCEQESGDEQRTHVGQVDVYAATKKGLYSHSRTSTTAGETP